MEFNNVIINLYSPYESNFPDVNTPFLDKKLQVIVDSYLKIELNSKFIPKDIRLTIKKFLETIPVLKSDFYVFSAYMNELLFKRDDSSFVFCTLNYEGSNLVFKFSCSFTNRVNMKYHKFLGHWKEIKRKHRDYNIISSEELDNEFQMKCNKTDISLKLIYDTIYALYLLVQSNRELFLEKKSRGCYSNSTKLVREVFKILKISSLLNEHLFPGAQYSKKSERLSKSNYDYIYNINCFNKLNSITDKINKNIINKTFTMTGNDRKEKKYHLFCEELRNSNFNFEMELCLMHIDKNVRENLTITSNLKNILFKDTCLEAVTCFDYSVFTLFPSDLLSIMINIENKKYPFLKEDAGKAKTKV